jgi:hypothetical protein
MKQTRRLGWTVCTLVAALAGCDPRTELTNIVPTLALSSTALSPTGTIAGPAVTETVTIVNGTDGTLENLSAQVQYLGPAGWLAVSLDRTTATRDQPATLQVSATPGNLPLGTYDAAVRLASPGAGNDGLTIAVRFTVDPRPPTKLAIVTQPADQATNGATLTRQPSLQLLNAIDEPARKAGVIITATLSAGGGQLLNSTTATTDTDGRATFADLGILGLVGNRTLTFTATNLAPATSTTIALGPGAATRIEAASATNQTVNAGTAVPEAPRVRIIDQSGNAIAGYDVTFSASAGSVIAPTGTIATSAAGLAGPTTWTISQLAGANTVTAAATGLEGSPVTFGVTGRAGPATQLLKQSGDNLVGLISTTLGTPHVAKVADQFGNGVAGVTVAWTAGGGGSVAPPSTVTDPNGLAQATRTLPGAAGPLTTTASATLSNGPAAAVFAVTAANAGPAQIVIAGGDLQSGQVGSTLPIPIRVQVLDAVGTPQPNVTVTFTTSNPGGAFPGGTTIQTDGTGFAQTTWRLGTQSGPQSAQAAVGGPAPAVFSATATPGPLSVAQSTLSVSPSTITAGGPASTITVTARDAGGNPIEGLAVAIAVVGSGTLTQPSGPTDAQGQAVGTFTATQSGNKSVSASIAGQALPSTATITVNPGTAFALVPVTSTGFAVRFGQAVSAGSLPTVRVEDQFGNGIAGVTVSFAITLGQSTRSPSAALTNSAGVAALSSWVIGPFTTVGNPENVYNRIVASVSLPLASVAFTGTTTVSYASDLYPWFAGCDGGGCHSANAPIVDAGAPALYTTLRNPNLRYVIPNDSTTATATTNLLHQMLSNPSLSHTGGQWPAEVVTVIKAWIRQGAPNN